MDSKVCVSIVTPTYNRGKLLVNCYESLVQQTSKDFEWIIVDDGSTDNTEEIVNQFQAVNNDFTITYVKKKNGGKHTALNESHKYIKGSYVLILDSDDILDQHAVAEVICEWSKYQYDRKIAILTFLKRTMEDSTPVCTVDEFDVPVDILRYRRIKIKSTDCCEVIRASEFKKYPFPVFSGERFVAECALWNRVAKKYQCVYINKVIYLCEYLQGGLSDSGRAMRIRNPMGGMFTSNLRMSPRNFLSQRIKYGLLFTCYGYFADLNLRRMSKYCDHKPLMLLCAPGGWIIYKRWKRQYING